MSSSEESDHIGHLAADYGNDESDLEQLEDEPGDDESDPDSDGSRQSNRFFDLEAVDSADERSESHHSGADDDDHGGLDTWSDNHFFPQFKSLPFELRHRIWEFFCPELTAKSRVFWFQAQARYWSDGSEGVVPVEGPFLEQQTRPARAMLALHRESRELALKVLPDTLSFGSHGVIRFNSEKDVVVLGSTETVMLDFDAMPQIPGFGEHIRHLAVEPTVLSDLGSRSSALFGAFENLKTVYYLTSPSDHRPQHLRWCASDLVKRYSIVTFEEEPGLGEDGEHMYCWPDVENHLAFADAKIPLEGLADDLLTPLDPIRINGAKFNDAPIWPMVQFLWDFDLRRFDDLLAWDGQGILEWESSEEDENGEPDEYESEGIDDSDISEDGPGSDEEQSVVVDDDDSHRDEEDRLEDSSILSGSPLPGSQDGAIDVTGEGGENAAKFSSPEQSSATLRGSEESEQESDQPGPRTTRLKRPRARVVDSDSENDSEDDGPRKRARTDTRRNLVVLSSDGEEDGQGNMRMNRRARPVIPEDEDDEDDEEIEGPDTDTGQGREQRVNWSGASGSDDGDEESDGGAAVSKPLSLAEKLQLHREKNPIPSSDDGDSESRETGGDDYDARDYVEFQDDEEGDEISEDGNEDDEYGHIGEDEDHDDYGY